MYSVDAGRDGVDVSVVATSTTGGITAVAKRLYWITRLSLANIDRGVTLVSNMHNVY